MPLSPGDKLGHFEILSLLGEGGMGVVYKARDTRLDRIVAVKISSARFSERFEREARAVAALNHPHISTLYDVGPDYLVMEYVEGSEIKGPLPLDQVLKYSIQLASALEAAHRKLITHRDLKPANIMITKAGVKVLDFGLAQMGKADAPGPIAENDATLTRALTQEGSILGTLQYMAPEQLQGKVVDGRADVFSFGCVLYEMLTGKRAFGGANTASVIAAILERPAPSVAGVAPAGLDWVLRMCLAKDSDERWQSATDLRAALERCVESGADSPGQVAGPPHNTWPAIAAGVLAVVLAGLAFVHFHERAAEMPVTRFTISPPENTYFPSSDGPQGFPTLPALSPDGRKLAFRAVSQDGKGRLWIRSLDAVAAQPLEGTEGGVAPFWSPDGKSIGFSADQKLKRIDLAGGPPLTLAESGYTGNWSSDGTILFSDNTGRLRKIPASGGAITDATKLDAPKELAHILPWFLPDGKSFLFVDVSPGIKFSIRVGSLGSLDTKVIAVSGDQAAQFAIFSSGSLLFLRGTTLMAQPFDTVRLTTIGDAVPVAEQIQKGNYSVSLNGTLVYAAGAATQRQLAWFDRAGKRLASVGEQAQLTRLNFSPDRRNAVAVDETGIFWIYDMARGVRNRLNFSASTAGGGSRGYDAIWSADGSTVVFNADGGKTLYRKVVNGGAEELLYKDELNKDPVSFSLDGKLLAYDVQGSKTTADIWILPNPLGPGPHGTPYALIHSEGGEGDPQISPDGRFIAWESDESGRYEIYAAAFPGLTGKRLISAKGGNWPRWCHDCDEIFYTTPDGFLAATALTVKGGVLEVGAVSTLLHQPVEGYRYDVSADGQKILAIVAPEQIGGSQPLTVVLNWPAALKK